MTTGAEARDFATLKQTGFEPKIHTIFDFTDEALQQLRLWLEMHPPSIGIQQVLGFGQFTAQFATVAAQHNTTSTTYTNLTSDGPELAELPAGKYLLLFGAAAANSGAPATGSLVSPSINGSTPDDNDSAQSGVVSLVSVAHGLVVTLSTDSNTVKLQYRVSGGTGDYARRWLVAFKYANT